MGSLFSKTWEKVPVGSYSPKKTFVTRDTASCDQKRILLIGTAGSGKSSFLNTIYTALFGTYRELAKSGSGSEGHVSKCLMEYDLSEVKDTPSTNLFTKGKLPVLVDMCGLPPNDAPTDRFEEVLRVILKGHLREGTDVYNLISNETEIPQCNNGVPIDRVVFVTAADEELPTAYCVSVRKVCEEVLGPEFKLFGVLTKGDQFKPETKDKYHKFVKMLQAVGTPYKVLVIANYCSAVCGESPAMWKGRKDIDDPILAFLAEISRPEYKYETESCAFK